MAKNQIILEKMISDFLMQLKNAPILILNTDFTIDQANEAFLSTTGKTAEEVEKSYCYQTIYGYEAHCFSAQPEFPCPVLETMRSKESAQAIHEFPTINNSSAFYNVVSYPIKNSAGEVVKVIEIWQDLTDEFLTRMNKRTKQLKDDINHVIHEDRMISLGKLSASCVHEINNPIQGLLTFSHLMEKTLAKQELSEDDIEDMRKYAPIMSAELERCGNIVSGLLSFAREAPGTKTNIELNDLINSVFLLTRHKMQLQNIESDIILQKHPLVIRGDKNQVQQCLLNIIFNAIEAMPEGGKLDIAIGQDETDRQCRVKITDTGCGISQENLGNIFDPFFSTKKENEGTGLGLSIAYGVIKSHGGDIQVTSKTGEGSTVTITFPMYLSDD